MSELGNYESIFQRALEHYKDRLDDMKDDPEIKIQKVKDDIVQHIERVEVRLKDLPLILKRGSLGEGDFRKDICLALSCYIDDTEKSIKDTKSKINDLNIDFKLANDEIALARKAKNQYCPNGWEPKIDTIRKIDD